MILKNRRDGSFNLSGKNFNLKTQPMKITISGMPHTSLNFGSVGSSAGQLGGVKGKIHIDIAKTEVYTVYRKTFISEDKTMAGISLSLENNLSTEFNLEHVMPFSIDGHDNFFAADTQFNNWHILRQARNKNDIPGCFKPNESDERDFKDASLDSTEIPAGMGVSNTDLEKHSKTDTTIISEPSIFIKNQKNMDIPGLFIAVLGQDQHLSQLVLTGNNENDTLKDFKVFCEFDYISIAPQEQRSTHWIIFREDQDHNVTYDKFNTMLADLYSVEKSPRPAPALYCTWYFYGQEFYEHDLDENLNALQKNNVPFDVFLLDDGWSDMFGSWQCGERFPGGMVNVVEKITAAGYRPGIWTCPFVVMADSPVVKEHPELIAKDMNGEFYTFPYQGPKCYTVDPTSPYAPTYFNKMYKQINDWGFTVHKFDFLRALLTSDNIRFYDKKVNRAQAYRLGMELVRKAIGQEPYILACGGLFEATIGLADGMRTGSDTLGTWNDAGYLKTIKQNIMRSNSNHFWHTDPDAAMLRLREDAFRSGNIKLAKLSLGNFNDEEAFSIVVNQYIGGGMMCFSERFAELQTERRELLRHIIPARFPVPVILDMFNPGCPSLFLSQVKPECTDLKDWWTLAVANWADEAGTKTINMSDLNLPKGASYVVFEFKEQKLYGIKSNDDTIDISLPAHGMRVFRIAQWDGKSPIIVGTDMHLTGGGVEIKTVTINEANISGTIQTEWDIPIKLTVGYIQDNQFVTETITNTGDKFSLSIK